MLSLSLTLVGAFTIVGTLAAIAVGILALRRIAREPNKLDGAEYARAGIIAGGVMTFITLAAFLSPTVFGIDQFLREMTTARKITYPPGEVLDTDDLEITKPSAQWGLLQKPNSVNQKIHENYFILYSTRDDAYLACQFATLEAGDKIEAIEKKILDQVLSSVLIDRIGRLGGAGWSGEQPIISERKKGARDNTQEITVDLRLAGINRRLLIQYKDKQGGGELPRSTVLIACARADRFSSLEEDFRKAFASFKPKIN
jgi:hypothetical protein